MSASIIFMSPTAMRMLSGKRPSIRIYADDESSWIGHVSISNLAILGEPITDFDQLGSESSPYNGESIQGRRLRCCVHAREGASLLLTEGDELNVCWKGEWVLLNHCVKG